MSTTNPESVWQRLAAHRAELGEQHLNELFAADPTRAGRMQAEACGLFLDYSKNRVTDQTLQLLLELAKASGLAQRRTAMFDGARINTTEQRAVLHTALRRPPSEIVMLDGRNVVADVVAVRERIARFAETVRCGDWLGYDGRPITDIVNIGIGGSDLGPHMAVLALDAYRAPGKRFHFVSNADGHELAGVLRLLRPQSTLFLVASKTFTTAETMTNARSCLDWFAQQGGTDVARHFVALTTQVDAAKALGITTTFGFWEWVGGRYSLWSSIGLPLAISIGAAGFRGLLAGGHAMDEHFRTAPLEVNLPVRLGVLDVWYRNFHGFTSRCVAPYHAGLRRWAAYLQQLEMESNGKRVAASGEALDFATSPVVWGEPGTNGQHAFFQMLHQGSDVLPLEIVAVRKPSHALVDHHGQVLANALAQAQALMVGKASDDGQRHFPGNRPSTFLLLESLTPESLGALIALQEHRVFVSGALWGIDSFDQWGVELGKVLARDLQQRLASGDAEGLDASTAGLLNRLRG